MKIACIGAGRVFSHYSALLKDHPDISIVSVFDLDINALSQYRSKYSICSSIHELVSCKPDLICILTPSGLHADVYKQAVEFRIPILVEKPLALKPEDARLMIELSGVHHVPIYCAFQNRFNEAVQAAKSLVMRGIIGNVLACHVSLEWCRFQDYYDDGWHGTWKLDGGVIAQQAIHHVDAALYLLGKATSVFGIGSNLINHLEAEDTFHGIIELESGVRITLFASTAFRPADRCAEIKIYGSDGTIEIGGIALNSLKLSSSRLTQEVHQDFPNGYGLSHIDLLEAIDHDISNNTRLQDSRLDISAAAHTTDVISALYASWENKSWAHVGKDTSSRWGAQLSRL